MSSVPGPGHSPARLSRWAVGLALAFGLAFVASTGTIAMFYAVGAESRIEDAWPAYLAFAVQGVSMLGCLAAFVLAIVSRVKGERWSLLWVPLCAFPALAALVVVWGALPGT